MSRRGQLVGMAVFVLGIVLLLFVFGVAYAMFTSAASEFIPSGAERGSSVTAAGLGSATALTLVRIALLFVMTLASSMLASKGIQLYLGSAGAGERDADSTSKCTS